MFVNEVQIADIKDYLASQKITVRPYTDTEAQLSEFNSSGIKVGIHMDTCNAELRRLC